MVATVLTVYGIETKQNACPSIFRQRCNSTYRLRYWNWFSRIHTFACSRPLLQQYLPFTVLKPIEYCYTIFINNIVAIALTACGIETVTPYLFMYLHRLYSCNSAYRLRYWNLPRIAYLLVPIVFLSCNSTYRLQYWNILPSCGSGKPSISLQQYLSFSVLKQIASCHDFIIRKL